MRKQELGYGFRLRKDDAAHKQICLTLVWLCATKLDIR